MEVHNTTVNNFRCMETRLDDKCLAGHTMFYKQHDVRYSHFTKPTGRTLLVLNVPPYCDKKSFTRVFGVAGSIKAVIFEEKPSGAKEQNISTSLFAKKESLGFKVAYVVFNKAPALKKALQMDWPIAVFSSKEHTIPTGLSKWIQEYEQSFIKVKDLSSEIENYMQQFDARKAREDEDMRMKDGQPDADGWITVTKHTNKSFARTQHDETKVSAKEKKNQKEKKLINFYSFQMKESKMEHLVQLRQKFEEDKKRIAAMKAARKFKPY